MNKSGRTTINVQKIVRLVVKTSQDLGKISIVEALYFLDLEKFLKFSDLDNFLIYLDLENVHALQELRK